MFVVPVTVTVTVSISITVLFVFQIGIENAVVPNSVVVASVVFDLILVLVLVLALALVIVFVFVVFRVPSMDAAPEKSVSVDVALVVAQFVDAVFVFVGIVFVSVVIIVVYAIGAANRNTGKIRAVGDTIEGLIQEGAAACSFCSCVCVCFCLSLCRSFV